jgi:hypothetical protein
MDIKKRHQTLVENALKLRDELLAMEKEFNKKKEEFLRIEGAITVLEEQITADAAVATASQD